MGSSWPSYWLISGNLIMQDFPSFKFDEMFYFMHLFFFLNRHVHSDFGRSLFWLHYETKVFAAILSTALMSWVSAEFRRPVINSSAETRVRESKRRGDRDALYASEQKRYS